MAESEFKGLRPSDFDNLPEGTVGLATVVEEVETVTPPAEASIEPVPASMPVVPNGPSDEQIAALGDKMYETINLGEAADRCVSRLVELGGPTLPHDYRWSEAWFAGFTASAIISAVHQVVLRLWPPSPIEKVEASPNPFDVDGLVRRMAAGFPRILVDQLRYAFERSLLRPHLTRAMDWIGISMLHQGRGFTGSNLTGDLRDIRVVVGHLLHPRQKTNGRVCWCGYTRCRSNCLKGSRG